MEPMGMETISARLESFRVAHRPLSKGRTSGVKAKPIAWPHRRPSPEELAHAGFYYQPTDISPDNTACFLCRYALDGWEDDDDPITEHLRHSSQCGWAMMMDITRRSSNPAEIADPTSIEITEARRATFGTWWPYDGKKGWKCKTEKMVEAGWYFCPNEESNDFVSCAYCNLSLDGWEPKDDPFDEHYRRSSECSFFHFASIPGKKGKRGSRSVRSSTASRISIQSTVSTLSTADDDSEGLRDSCSQPLADVPMPAKRSKATRKTKAKKDEVTLEVDDHEERVEKSGPKKRGRKRKSEEIAEREVTEITTPSVVISEPAAKRRATGSRKASVALSVVVPDITDDELHAPTKPAKRQPKGRTTKKRNTSSSRVSTASTTPSTSQIPDDSEIEAQLEADLERTNVDILEQGQPLQIKSKKTRRSNDTEGHSKEPTPKGSRKKAPGKKKITKESLPKSQDNEELLDDTEQGRQASFSDEVHRGLEDPETATLQAPGKEEKLPIESIVSPKQNAGSGQRKSRNKKDSFEKAKEIPMETMGLGSILPGPNHIDLEVAVREQEITIFDEAQAGLRPEQTIYENSPGILDEEGGQRRKSIIPSATSRGQAMASSLVNPASPSPFKGHTPSPSPQASDAENRPPSSGPSARHAVPSSSVSRAPPGSLGPSTPGTSTRRAFDHSIYSATPNPWSPADLGDALLPRSANKENVDFKEMLQAAKGDLTSPEKRMTVEEWIAWNAKKGELKLRNECERLVNLFESEGGRAMRVLEEVECID
ncbi:hypothetical protein LOZ51_000763 [Ophidiomyces ophidiicola]|nr:hypothetical protein LOZ55_000442 [Ophidiomyces ophidiicola]KAI1996648.1 hypothetical protein LOZ54_000019 [Ophidiomyces ophidiicola]KAI2003681.1 hypothetical protein LOZ51_000763 [Ophidiomyces ophidiicola]